MELARAPGDRERDSAWPVVVAVVLTLGLSGQPGARQGVSSYQSRGGASITESSQGKAGAAPAGPGTSGGTGHEWGARDEPGHRAHRREAGSGLARLHLCPPSGREAGRAAGRQHELGTREHRAAGLRAATRDPAGVGARAAARAALLHLPARPARVSPAPAPGAPSRAAALGGSPPPAPGVLGGPGPPPPPKPHVPVPLTSPFTKAGASFTQSSRRRGHFIGRNVALGPAALKGRRCHSSASLRPSSRR